MSDLKHFAKVLLRNATPLLVVYQAVLIGGSVKNTPPHLRKKAFMFAIKLIPVLLFGQHCPYNFACNRRRQSGGLKKFANRFHVAAFLSV
ncbi:MAG: hypothetical protein CV087_10935 [Candidatus Brocadia sp. WS118]|nr:MAG: hypothetical protein CV087_10935 [Candidatus Brocadia sp. WS118]